MQTERGRSPFETTALERDLRLLISDNLSVREQVKTAAATANRMLGRLKKAFRSRGFKLWRCLYLTFIRPHLEFFIQAWRCRNSREGTTACDEGHHFTQTLTI